MAVPTQRTNLGPLTTTFSAPSSCSLVDGSFTKTGGGLNGEVGYACHVAKHDGQIFGADEACFPNSLASYVNTGEDWLTSVAVYSPGSVCPHGFSSACTMTRSAGDEAPTTGRNFETASRAVFNILEIGETAIGCCPNGYTCANDEVYKCYTPGTVGQVITGIIRETSCTPKPTTFTIQSLSETTSVADGRRLIMIQGSPNGETDSPMSTRSGSSSSSSSSTSSSLASQGDGSGSSSPENTSGSSHEFNHHTSGGLAPGAKIAIGVTIPVVAILAGLAIFMIFFIRKRRRNKAENEKRDMIAAAAAAPGSLPPPSGPQELAGTAGYVYQHPGREPFYKPELLGQPLSEAPGHTVYDQTSELPGNNQQVNWEKSGPTHAELAANPPNTGVVGSNGHHNAVPAAPASTQAPYSSTHNNNEPWKWNQPLYPETQ